MSSHLMSKMTAVVFVGLSAGFALADEFSAVITKVDAVTITFHKVKEGKKAGEASTLPAAENVSVALAEFNRETKNFSAGDLVQGGLKNEIFTRITEKGVGVRIVTGADNNSVTHILVIGGKKKKEG